MSALSRRGELFTHIVLEVFRLNRLLLEAGDELTAPVGLTSARWQVDFGRLAEQVGLEIRCSTRLSTANTLVELR